MKQNVYFVSGIDTDAGKSYATGFLAREWNKNGQRTMTQKFIQTGNIGHSEEIHTDSMVNHFEVFQIDTFRKLVFAFHIHIIHQDVLIRANQWKDTRTLYCILRLLLIVI